MQLTSDQEVTDSNPDGGLNFNVDNMPRKYMLRYTQNCLSVLSLNICSIRNKLDYVKTNLLYFNIICFIETHLTVGITDIELEGYSVPYVKIIQHFLVVFYEMSLHS